MADSTVTVTVNTYPDGVEATITKARIFGTIAIGAGSYPANGLPVAFSGLVAGFSGDVIDSEIKSCSSGFVYRYDKAHSTIRIFVTGTAANDPLNEVTTTTPSGVVSDAGITFITHLNRVTSS